MRLASSDTPFDLFLTYSQNPHHTELGWLLNCITPLGKLKRMTTWKVFALSFLAKRRLIRLKARLAASRNAKDESEVDDSLLNAGLFTYPVLQAADILLYKCVSHLLFPTSF